MSLVIWLLSGWISMGMLQSCHSSTEVNNYHPGLEFVPGTLPPNRPGEEYALWIEFPARAITSPELPQHGLYNTQLVTTFRILPDGTMQGYDTTGFFDRVGISYALFVQAEISVEQIGNLGTFPSNTLAFGAISGSSDLGIDTMRATHFYAFGDTIRSLDGFATMASSTSTPNDYKGEVYLMNATNPNNVIAGLTNFPVLTKGWSLGTWVIDSSETPPVQSFLGFFNAPDKSDSRSANDHFPFPGGRTPDDPTKPVVDLTTGHATLLVTGEPRFGNTIPVVPSGIVILEANIPQGVQSYSPFALQNMAQALPWAILRVQR